MNRNLKVIEKFKENPKNVSFSKIDKLLCDMGFLKKEGKGSHRIYKKNKITLTIPVHNNETKILYKKLILKQLITHNLL